MTAEKTLTPKQLKKREQNLRYRNKMKAKKEGGEAPRPEPTPAPEPEPETPALRADLLIYDIPDDSELTNPSSALRRIGFRANLSCWVIPQNATPLALINTLREGGADVDLVKFDAAEGPRLVEMGRRKMKKEIDRQIAATRASLLKAEQDLLLEDETVSVEERYANHERFVSRTTAALKRLEDLADDLGEAVKNFGVDPGEVGIPGARSWYNRMQDGIAEKAAVYVEAANALRATQTATNVALANAAMKDQVPHYPMADALREAGNDEAADRLQAAFGEGQAPAAPEKKLSMLAAAARVLDETGREMTCPELIGAMAARGYWTSPGGKTPAATLSAGIGKEIETKGAESRFRKTAPGRFAAAVRPEPEAPTTPPETPADPEPEAQYEDETPADGEGTFSLVGDDAAA